MTDDMDFDVGGGSSKIYVSGATLGNGALMSLVERLRNQRWLTVFDITTTMLSVNMMMPNCDLWNYPPIKEVSKRFPLGLNTPHRKLSFEECSVWILSIERALKQAGLLGGSQFTLMGDDDE